MRNYEIMFILKPGSTDEENDKLIAAMEGVVTSHKGEMLGVEKMGKKKLAYRIDKFDEGYYILFKLNADGEAIRTNVKLGRSSVNQIEIVDGLQPGDQVIL